MSLRTTAAIITALSVLLLVNVLVPQAAIDPSGYAEAARRGGASRFMVVTMGLGQLSTSAVFLATLAVFFVNLAAVLVDRARTTVRRIGLALPTKAQIEGLLDGPASTAAATGWEGDPGRARNVLETLGYRVVPVAAGVLWGVKHRAAMLGFAVFHLAFFVLAVAGGLLYATRDVVTLSAVEGQWVDSAAGGVVRRAPVGAPEQFRLSLERVDVRLEQGAPIDLAATIRLDDFDGAVRTTRVNHPAVRGDTTILVERAGIAPVLWVLDERDFTVDRVAVATSAGGGFPSRLPLGSSGLEAVVEPIAVGAGFPERSALSTAPVALRLEMRDRVVFDGSLRPGESVDVEGLRVRLKEVKYWAGLRLVSERGGGWLIAGFVLSVVGIMWRMVWYRREIVVAFEDGRLRVAARGEFYPGRARAEAERILSLLAVRPNGGERSGG